MLRKILDLFRPKSMLIVRFNLDHVEPDSYDWVVGFLMSSIKRKWGSGMDISFMPSYENTVKVIPKKRSMTPREQRFLEMMIGKQLRTFIENTKIKNRYETRKSYKTQ